MKISKKMTIGDILENHPEAAEIMMQSGMHCVGCPATMFESLEDGAKAHGLKDEDINKMVEEINRKISKKK